MYFNPALGMQGNIEKSLQNTINEETSRALADRENREAVEQSITDSYLDHIASEQYMTDLEIRIIELEGKA